jgi:hypothetical protein
MVGATIGIPIAAVTAQYAKGLSPICHSRQILEDFTTTWLQIYVTLYRCDDCDMPTVTQTICKVPTLADVLDAEFVQNPPDLENLFLHRWMRCCTDRSFTSGDFFKQKNGSTTICVGLNYSSMGSYHSPSRNTVLLMSLLAYCGFHDFQYFYQCNNSVLYCGTIKFIYQTSDFNWKSFSSEIPK